MRAVAAYPANRSIDLVDHPEPPAPQPHQVKLRMLEVGVCGTDREIASFQYGTPPGGAEYLVIGHESLGEVVEVGTGVQGLAPGDLAVPRVRRPCPHDACTPCRADEPDFCYTGDYTERGIKGAHGYLAEYVVADASYVHKISTALRDVAVLTEPLSIAEKGLHQIYQIRRRLPGYCRHGRRRTQPTHRAVVIGAGPVGVLGAMALVTEGFDTVVFSREPTDSRRARLVEAFGATYLSSEDHAARALAERVGRIDVVYEAAGAATVAYDVLLELGTNGIFVFTGVPGRKAPVQIDVAHLMRDQVLKNQVVLGTVNAGRDDFQAAITHLGTFMDRWPDAVREVIAGRHPMEETVHVLTERLDGIKQVIVTDTVADGGSKGG